MTVSLFISTIRLNGVIDVWVGSQADLLRVFGSGHTLPSP